MNDDGATTVGYCTLQNNYRHSVCWLGGATKVTSLNCLADHSNTWAYSVSSDRNVIVDESTELGNPSIGHAVLWKRNPDTNEFNIENLKDRPEPPQNIWKEQALGVNHDGTVIVGYVQAGKATEAFIWREDATPQVQKLEDITKGYKYSVAYDVIKKADGTIIIVGSSVLRDDSQAAVRWNNLSIDNLNVPS